MITKYLSPSILLSPIKLITHGHDGKSRRNRFSFFRQGRQAKGGRSKNKGRPQPLDQPIKSYGCGQPASLQSEASLLNDAPSRRGTTSRRPHRLLRPTKTCTQRARG